jgi:hypothetical protein
LAVAVTITEYVPAGVFLLLELGGGELPPPPPAPAQLVTTKELKKTIVMKNSLERLWLNASGSMKRPRAANSMRDVDALGAWSRFCAEVEARPVAICTVALPVAFAVTTSVTGLKLQTELDGSALQAKVKVPLDALIVARLIVNVAVWPLAIVRLERPADEMEKSNPIPERETWVCVARSELETVRLPVCWPALDGEKAICVVQLPPTASDDVQVVDAIWN